MPVIRNPFRNTTWAILALFVILLVLSFRPISDPDIWFYLVQGRELALTGQVPPNEFYIFPALGEAASYPALGFGLLYYFVHQAAGYVGMAVLNALAAAVGVCLMLLAVREGDYRPENLLFVFLGAEFVILERWLKTRRSELVFAVLPLVALLSLFHTSAVLLPALQTEYRWHFIATCLLAAIVLFFAPRRHLVDGNFVRPSFVAEYHDRVFRADPDRECLLASHDVRYALTPATLPYSGDIIPLVRVMAERQDWSLDSVEPAGLMLARGQQ